MKQEKVYISRDEGSDKIWVWRKPIKGNWSPVKMPDCGMVVWSREDINNANCYLVFEFKKKFGFIISAKTKKCCHIDKQLLNNEDYKMFSNDPDRKK